MLVETWHQKDWLKLSCAKSYSWSSWKCTLQNNLQWTSFLQTIDFLDSISTHSRQSLLKLDIKKIDWNLVLCKKLFLILSLKMHPPNNLHGTSFFGRRWIWFYSKHSRQCILIDIQKDWTEICPVQKVILDSSWNAPSQNICNGTSFFADDRFWFYSNTF